MVPRKPRPSLALPSWVFGIFSFVFLAQVLPGLWTNALTNDEPVEITNGYYALTRGDVAGPHHYGPVATVWSALPLLALDLQRKPFQGDVLDRAHAFLFEWNKDRIRAITVACRLPNLLLVLGLGWLLFRVTRRERDLCFATLFLWAFNPALLAHAPLAKSDMPACFLFFSTVLLFERSRRDPRPWVSLGMGACFALATASKFSCLALLPAFILLETVVRRPGEGQDPLKRWAWGGVGCLLILGLVYLPGSLTAPKIQWPYTLFVEKLVQLIRMNRSHFPVFFMGNSGFENHWAFYPVTFFLKDPTVFLGFLTFGTALALLKKIPLPPWIWIPPAVFGILLIPALNEGIRFLLPVFPFTFLIAGQGIVWSWRRRPKVQRSLPKFLVAGLLAWQGLAVLFSFPGYLSYFNEFVPSTRKVALLADSNLDWGQDLGRVARRASREGWGRVRLAFLGGSDPSAYGLDWEPWRRSDLKGPRPGATYLVNVSFFQLAPLFYPETLPIAAGWLSETAPTGKLGDSWFVFRIPGPPPPEDPRDPILASVPFQQKRGYTPYPPAPIPAHQE